MDKDLTREKMVASQIKARGVTDRAVLEAMERVPREEFVDDEYRSKAYQDRPLPIAEEQTISQPYIVAAMIEALKLKAGDRVLEVGTGSGYAAAVMAEIASEVFTVERHRSLADSARQRLARLGFRNVQVRHGDGTEGWTEAAPFDAVTVAAGGERVPEALKEQLKIGGRLVIPVGPRSTQDLLLFTRVGQKEFEEENLGKVRFVPLVKDN